MNVRVHRAVSDIDGVTGLAIMRAIISGERDARKLAQLRDPRCRNSEEEIAQQLSGHWREDHLFSLRQALRMYDAIQERIADYRAVTDIDGVTGLAIMRAIISGERCMPTFIWSKSISLSEKWRTKPLASGWAAPLPNVNSDGFRRKQPQFAALPTLTGCLRRGEAWIGQSARTRSATQSAPRPATAARERGGLRLWLCV
jgi:hypothetical protein